MSQMPPGLQWQINTTLQTELEKPILRFFFTEKYFPLVRMYPKDDVYEDKTQRAQAAQQGFSNAAPASGTAAELSLFMRK